MKFIKKTDPITLTDKLQEFFRQPKVHFFESLLVHLEMTHDEYFNLKIIIDDNDNNDDDNDNVEQPNKRLLEMAELKCKESVLQAGFDDNKFSTYYHKETYSEIPEFKDEPLDINITNYTYQSDSLSDPSDQDDS